MTIDGPRLEALVAEQLEHLSDSRVLSQIERLVVKPVPILRAWSYSKEHFPCWPIINDEATNTSIVYCQYGFGPRCPWGLVWLAGDELTMSMGQDSGWFPRLLDAYFDSRIAARLPIWRVIEMKQAGQTALTDEDSWDATWEWVYALRREDPSRRYDAGHTITY